MLNTVNRAALHTRRPLLTVVAGLLLLAGCAPRETNPARAVAETPVSNVSFYPSQVGLSWRYVPEGEALDSPAYTLSSRGATLFGDQPAIAYHFTGRGADQVSYRRVSDQGQFLLGFTKPGVMVTLDPPLQEYPAADAWRPQLAWGGQSRVRVLTDGKVASEGNLQYRYTVLEKRRVTAPDGQTYDVWVVNRQLSGDASSLFPESSQNFWFAPHVGEILTPERLLQVGRNFRR